MFGLLDIIYFNPLMDGDGLITKAQITEFP